MISFSTKVEVAPVNVMTSNDGGLSDEQIAQMAVDKIVSVSDNAPDVIEIRLMFSKKMLKKFCFIICSWQEEKKELQ